MTPLYVPDQAVNWIREHYAFLAKYQMCPLTAWLAVTEAPQDLRPRMDRLLSYLVENLKLPYPSHIESTSMFWGRGGEKYELNVIGREAHIWREHYHSPADWITYTQTLVESPHEHG